MGSRGKLARQPVDPKELPVHGEARRQFLVEAGALTTGLAASPYLHSAETGTRAPATPGASQARAARVRMTVNGRAHELDLDPRVTLLDALREHLRLTGTKKGCDRGQCGACTVLVNGRRINSCLSLALAHEGDEIVTVEGLGSAQALHPVQRAFVDRDAFQCGYCTPGQVCSGVALIAEARAGAASAATADVRKLGPAALTDDEIRERMSGNLCRCGAYVNIVAAIRDASKRT
jgi:xanthine dehydrogenase YagT iron-sulfur-binding subunit